MVEVFGPHTFDHCEHTCNHNPAFAASRASVIAGTKYLTFFKNHNSLQKTSCAIANSTAKLNDVRPQYDHRSYTSLRGRPTFSCEYLPAADDLYKLLL